MILSFLPRLLSIGLAVFFLVHLLLGLAASLFTSTAVGRAERMRAAIGAHFLLGVRLFAPAAALVAVICIVGDYTWLEPSEPAEDTGLVCLIAAALGLLVFAIPISRAIMSALNLTRYLRQCERDGRETRLPGDRVTVLVIDSEQPFLALAGLTRPRLVISSSALQSLSAAELGVAVRHERAHRLAQDNVKRLLLLLAPDVFPFCRCFRGLERGWVRLAEWAADDRAVAGSPSRSVLLAGALVRIARDGKFSRTPAIVTPLVAGVQELSERVNRLLGEKRSQESRRRLPAFAFGIVLLLLVSVASLAVHPATMRALHSIVEEFHEAAL